MKVVAFDTETKGLDWFNPDQQAFLATWADEDGEYCADLSDEDQVHDFLEALELADIIVAHNLSFDVHQVRATLKHDILYLYTDCAIEVHDTDLMSRVLYPEGAAKGSYGLKHLAKVHLRADAGDAEEDIAAMAKQIGLRTLKQTGAYHEVWRAYPEVMEKYAKLDARYTYDLYKKFEPLLGDVRKVYELEQAVAPILIRAEERGIKTDQVACQRLKLEYEGQLLKVRENLEQELGEDALGGPGSDDALLEALLGAGIPLHRKTATGKLATNQYALAEFSKDFPVIAHLEEFRRLEKFLSTYIGTLDGRDVVHPSFRQLGAWTGRMSCTRPNMQNVPKRAGKEVREILVPREGHAFVVVDYDSIEARLLAYYLNDPDYSELIESGHDPHAWMASHIWGGAMEDYLKGTPGEAKRNTAKNTTYAIVYGAGGKRVTDMNGLDPGPWYDADHPLILAARAEGRKWPQVGWQYHEAKALISKVKTSLPNFWKLNKRIRNKVETVGHVNTLFGRKNPVSKDKAYVGLNALIQGSAADIMKQGLVNVDAGVRLRGGIPLLVVHDEVVCEVPVENAEQALPEIEMAMEMAFDLTPRLAVSGSVVYNSYADA